jgi:hypothetical protein
MDLLLVVYHCSYGCFLRCLYYTPYPLTPSRHPARACFTAASADSTTIDSLGGSHASVVLDSPPETPGLLSQDHLSCPSPQASCVSGASDLVSDDEAHISCVHVPSPQQRFPVGYG